MMVEYYCRDCYGKEGATKRIVPYELYVAKKNFYCILCAKPMDIYTGVNDSELKDLTGEDLEGE